MQGIFWYRDYWSNRQKLGRNILGDIKKDNPKSLKSELFLNQESESKIDLVDTKDFKESNLENPMPLMKDFDPHLVGTNTEKGFDDFGILSRMNTLKGKIDMWFGVLIAPTVAFILALIFQLGGFWSLIIAILIFFGMYLSMKSNYPDHSEAQIYFYKKGLANTRHFRNSNDVPFWLKNECYWVIRYKYKWTFEVTAKREILRDRGLCKEAFFPVDWERIDVWIEAGSGVLEWLVSDYHYRELWYEAEGQLKSVYTRILPNSHTPIPNPMGGSLKEQYDHWVEYLARKRAVRCKVDEKFFEGLSRRAVGVFLESLPWRHVRYLYGADNERRYRNGNEYANYFP